MNLKFHVAAECSATTNFYPYETLGDAIDWTKVGKVGQLLAVGDGDLNATYLIKSVNGNNLELAEIYRRVGRVNVTRTRLDTIRPLMFLDIPAANRLKAVKVGAIYQLYPTGTVITATVGKHWLTVVDREPIILPTIPKFVVRKDPPEVAGNTEE